MTTLVLHDQTTDQHHVIDVRRLLVAGFTGRDQAAVAEHVEELAALGVPVPERTPTLYRLLPELVRQTPAMVVTGKATSGEVEPVIVVVDGRQYLTVGSDHTDREVERTDIGLSKAACPKVIGTTCVPLDAVHDLDRVSLESTIDGEVRYQQGTMAALLPLPELLATLERTEDLTLQDGDVLFLGTLPAIGGIRPSPSFAACLRVPDLNRDLDLAYRVIDISSAGSAPMAKPEIEFTPVTGVEWTAIPGGVAGQSERILASDPANGIATRMLRFEPGTDTTALGVLRHDFWEEVYIVEGELHDLTLDQVFPAGTYACRPPGMPHGPWRSDPGCVTFEVRYPAG